MATASRARPENNFFGDEKENKGDLFKREVNI